MLGCSSYLSLESASRERKRQNGGKEANAVTGNKQVAKFHFSTVSLPGTRVVQQFSILFGYGPLGAILRFQGLSNNMNRKKNHLLLNTKKTWYSIPTKHSDILNIPREQLRMARAMEIKTSHVRVMHGSDAQQGGHRR